MIARLFRKIHEWERSLHDRFTHDIVDPFHRRQSKIYVDWFDHGVLRRLWHNYEKVAPGVFRSNHPDHDRLEDMVARGIRTILNVRGGQHLAHHKFEEESCRKLGLELVTVPMSARTAPEAETLLNLIRVMGEIEKPFLMHCKSGADRTGLAAAIYLMHYENAPLSVARRQLHPRFLHFRQTKTGILDHVLDLYGERLKRGPIPFADWIATEYDRDSAAQWFDRKPRKSA